MNLAEYMLGLAGDLGMVVAWDPFGQGSSEEDFNCEVKSRVKKKLEQNGPNFGNIPNPGEAVVFASTWVITNACSADVRQRGSK